MKDSHFLQLCKRRVEDNLFTRTSALVWWSWRGRYGRVLGRRGCYCYCYCYWGCEFMKWQLFVVGNCFPCTIFLRKQAESFLSNLIPSAACKIWQPHGHMTWHMCSPIWGGGGCVLALERHREGLAAELTCAFFQTAPPTPLHNLEHIKFGLFWG